MDISKELVAKSDQMNAIDLARDVTVTIIDVFKGQSDKRVHVITDIYGTERPFKPSKTVLRDIAQAWGLESQVWVGRRLTLFNDTTVLWAGQESGGIRVRAMSHIDKAFEAKHAISRTTSKKVMIEPLAAPAPRDWLTEAATLTDPAALNRLGHAAHAANADADTMGKLRAMLDGLTASTGVGAGDVAVDENEELT